MDEVAVEDVVIRLLEALDRAAIDYVLVGSLASNFYGVSRSTQDADVVISPQAGHLRKLLLELGPQFRRVPQMAFETVTGTTKTLVTDTQSQFQIEIFSLSGDDHDQQRFSRRRNVALFGRTAYILSVEDVVITKLLWLHLASRAKDEADVRAVIQLQQNRMDWPYVELWCERHNTRPLLDRLRQECTPE